MNRSFIKILIPNILLVFLLGFLSCQRLVLEPVGAKDPLSIFDEFYEVMDEKFVLKEGYDFDYKAVMPQMRTALVADPSTEKLKSLFKDLFQQIGDGHSDMTNGSTEKFGYNDAAGAYPKIIDKELLERKYLNGNGIKIIRKKSLIGEEISLAYGILPGTSAIGYLYIPSFNQLLSSSQIDDVFKALEDARGLILDLRGNGGGYVNVATDIASRFYESDKEIGIIRIKLGKDKTKDFPFMARASKGGANFVKKPVVVLADRQVFSAASVLSEVLRGTIKPTFVGQRTGGGASGFVSGILSNGWTYRVATSEIIRIENGMKIYSNRGFDPDIPMGLDAGDSQKDAVIGKAIELLR